MNTRKLLFIIAAIFSCISVLIPFYSVRCEGISNGVVVEGSDGLSLIKTFSGIAILVSAVAIIVSVVFIKKKAGYMITAILNVACSIWGLLYMLNNPVDVNSSLDTLRKLDPSFSTFEGVAILEAGNGIGSIFVIASIIIVLVTMFALYISKDED